MHLVYEIALLQMAKNTLGQGTYQVQTQTQMLSPQQVLVARLTELPLEALRERIDKELNDNYWLEAEAPNRKEDQAADKNHDNQTSDSTNDQTDKQPEEQDDRYDDDQLPVAQNGTAETSTREWSNPEESFYDHLLGQVSEYELTPHEEEVVRYLIGSLEDDGLLHLSMRTMLYEMDVYHAIETTAEELQRLLVGIVQQMEPAGVGARNLQECLLLQARRRYHGERKRMLERLLVDEWDDFSHTRWNNIKSSLKIDDEQLEQLRHCIRRMTPKPGGSMSNAGGTPVSTIIPDMVVEQDEQGRLHLSLNESDLPRLSVSPDAEVNLSLPTVTRAEKEAQKYVRGCVEDAQMFIKALAQRRQSMLLTMKAIIKLQRPFFLEGDETLLRPMKLDDVAALTGLDISTTSRVCGSKYVQTDFGTYPLRWFFTSAAVQDGEEVSIKKILDTLKMVVEGENKKHPLSDDKLAQMLRERGYDVARRTIAKYRDQLGIPESRLRRG